MSIINRYRALILISGFVSLLMLSSCATNEHGGKMIGAGVGAGLGALIAQAAGLDPAIGAAIGGGAGFLAGAAYDYNTKKTKDAPEVENDYKNEHEGQLPVETIVTRYQTRTDPSSLVRRGGELNFYSEIEIVKGVNSQEQQDQMQEELIIYNDMQGSDPISSKKDVEIDSYQSGAYETKLAFKFKPSDDLEQGRYDYKKILYLNDEPVKESGGEFQVVRIGQQFKVVFTEACSTVLVSI